ncbi:MAG: insulinase family protein [Candidatus Eremiobacterota bacterium]
MKNKSNLFAVILSIILMNITCCYAADFHKESPYTLMTIENSDIVYIVISFNTGTVRDSKGKEGLNFVTTTLIEDNIKRKLNEKSLTSGAEFYGQVDKEITTFFFKVHRDKFDETYPLFISEIISPDINKDSFERAIEQAQNVREYLINDCEDMSLQGLEMFLYRDHPYGTADSGTLSSLKNISIDDVKDFHAKFYRKENFRAAIASKNCKEILEKVTGELSQLPAGKPEDLIIKNPEPFNKRVLIIKKDSGTTAMAMGFPVDFTRSDDDYYPLLVANSRFGFHRYMQGFLFIQLRSIRGFNYGNYSYIEKFIEGSQDKMPRTRIARQSQYFYIWIRNLSDENATFAAKFTVMNLDKMIKEGLDKETFELNRDFIKNNSKLWAFDPFQKIGFEMDSDFYKTPYYIDYIEKKMDSMKNEDVTAALQKHMDVNNMKFVFVTSDPEKMKKRLLGEILSNPVYETNLSEEDKHVDEAVLQYDLKLKAEEIEIINAEELFK